MSYENQKLSPNNGFKIPNKNIIKASCEVLAGGPDNIESIANEFTTAVSQNTKHDVLEQEQEKNTSDLNKENISSTISSNNNNTIPTTTNAFIPTEVLTDEKNTSIKQLLMTSSDISDDIGVPIPSSVFTADSYVSDYLTAGSTANSVLIDDINYNNIDEDLLNIAQENNIRPPSDSSSIEYSSTTTESSHVSPRLDHQQPTSTELVIAPVQQSLLELRHEAVKMSLDIDRLLTSLKKSVDEMTTLSLQCVNIYRNSVDDMCEQVDESIKNMYMLMTKCEKIDKYSKSTTKLSQEVHDINIKLQYLEKLFAK